MRSAIIGTARQDGQQKQITTTNLIVYFGKKDTLVSYQKKKLKILIGTLVKKHAISL